jgi:hypothetical protein
MSTKSETLQALRFRQGCLVAAVERVVLTLSDPAATPSELGDSCRELHRVANVVDVLVCDLIDAEGSDG